MGRVARPLRSLASRGRPTLLDDHSLWALMLKLSRHALPFCTRLEPEFSLPAIGALWRSAIASRSRLAFFF